MGPDKSGRVHDIAWFRCCVIDGHDHPTSATPERWAQYEHEAEALYEIAHGADAETVAFDGLDAATTGKGADA